MKNNVISYTAYMLYVTVNSLLTLSFVRRHMRFGGEKKINFDILSENVAAYILRVSP